MREYIAARLVEINDRLAELDALPDPIAHRVQRKRLVAEGVELLAALATFSGEAASLN